MRVDIVLTDRMDLAGVSSESRSPALTVEMAVVVRTWEVAGKNDDAPRTVWVEVAEAFLRSTLRRSGERGGGAGAAEEWLNLVGEDERLDLVDLVDNAIDERDVDMMPDTEPEGIRSTV